MDVTQVFKRGITTIFLFLIDLCSFGTSMRLILLQNVGTAGTKCFRKWQGSKYVRQI